MKKIIFINSDKTGCGYYRCFLPALLLKSSGFHVQFNDFFEEKMLFDFDYVILQRCYSVKALEAIKINKIRKSKVFYEIDDDLLNLPSEHFLFDFFREKKTVIRNLMKNCDGIITSTEYLMKNLEKYNKNIFLMPNFIYQAEIIKKQKKTDSKFRILYAGTKSHQNDFKKVNPVFTKLQSEYNIELIFVGFKPIDFNSEYMKYYPPVEIWEYIKFLSKLKIDIGIAPLNAVKFNKSKSDIKFREYSYCGIPGIYKNYGPYEKIDENYGLKYQSNNDLYRILKRVIKNKNELFQFSEKTKVYAYKNFNSTMLIPYLESIYQFKYNKNIDLDSIYKKIKHSLINNFNNKFLKFEHENYLIYGYSDTGKLIEKFLLSKNKKILRVFDSINPEVFDKLDKTLLNTPIIIASKGYSPEIFKKVKKIGFKYIYSIY